MDGDMNEIFQKLNTILSDKTNSENLQNILNNFSSSNNDASNTTDSKNSKKDETQSFGNLDFDLNTILKLKSIMNSINNNENDSRANLLLSLKPYMRESKKDKIDKYIKFLNIAKVLENINPMNGDTNKDE